MPMIENCSSLYSQISDVEAKIYMHHQNSKSHVLISLIQEKAKTSMPNFTE
jgi:hypothetical protein